MTERHRSSRAARAGLAAVAAAALAVGAAAMPGPAADPGARPVPDPATSPAAGPLPFLYDLYTFRGQADSTLVLAAYAVPALNLQNESVGRQVRYRFDVTLVLADTAAGTLMRTDDSVYVRLTRMPTRRHLLSTHIEMQARPSVTTVQHVIMSDAATPGVGQLFTASAPIPDYTGDHLMLSDLALSRPWAAHGWRRGDVILALLPTAEFPRSAFDVYYEVYNLPAGRRYTTEIAVDRVADARGRPVEDDPVRVRYDGRSIARADGTLPELRFVDAAVSDGRYRITVTVTDLESGEAASRSRYFQVSGAAPDATLVPALPRRGQPSSTWP